MPEPSEMKLWNVPGRSDTPEPPQNAQKRPLQRFSTRGKVFVPYSRLKSNFGALEHPLIQGALFVALSGEADKE